MTMRTMMLLRLALLGTFLVAVPLMAAAAEIDGASTADAAVPPAEAPKPAPSDRWSLSSGAVDELVRRFGTFAQVVSALIAGGAAIIAVRAQMITAKGALATIHERFWNDKDIATIRTALFLPKEREPLMSLLGRRCWEAAKKRGEYETELCSDCYKRIDQLDQFLSVLFRVSALEGGVRRARRRIKALIWPKAPPDDDFFEYWAYTIRKGPYPELRAYAVTFYSRTARRMRWRDGKKKGAGDKTAAHDAPAPAYTCLSGKCNLPNPAPAASPSKNAPAPRSNEPEQVNA
jgi:hypothetical protein